MDTYFSGIHSADSRFANATTEDKQNANEKSLLFIRATGTREEDSSAKLK